MLRLIPAHEYRRERWRNGLGWTREILRQPDGEDWDWRLSVAEIEADAPFSTFAGVERCFVLLHGEGLRLHLQPTAGDDDSARVLAVEPPHGRCRFTGESDVRAELMSGPVHAFNLMWRRTRVEADLWHRPLVGAMVLFAEPGECWAIFLLGGRATLGGDDTLLHLAAQDTAVIAAGNTRLRCMLDGGGEVLLIRVRNLSEQTG